MAKKRGNNEGSIHRRKNGTWRAQVTLQGQRLSHTAKTRRECQDWLKQMLNQIDNGLTYKGTLITYQEYLSDWLVSIEPTLRPTTHYHYSQIVRDHIVPILGEIKLLDLRPDHIQNLYNQKRKSGLGIRTIQLTHSVVHRSLVHALRLGLIHRNPAATVIRPKPEQKEMKIYDEGQISQFLVAAKGNRFEALYHLAISTGMRQGELLGLLWTDLDWLKQTLHVQRQLRKVPGKGYSFQPPKTKYGRRMITLGSNTIQKLREHQRLNQEERIEAGIRWQENNLIFPSTVGTPMEQRNLHRDFKSIIKKAGLPDIRFHDLRHTAASIMLNHGVPVIVVSRRLGHSKPSITLDIYGHLIPGMQAEIAEQIDELITPVEIALHPVAPEAKNPLTE